MMMDKEATLATAQALAGTGNLNSENVYDLGPTMSHVYGGKPTNDPGRGEPLTIWAQVVATATGGTSVQAQLVTADDAALASNLTVIQETVAVPVASLKAGYMFRLGSVPAGVKQRYMALRFVRVGTFTAGNVSAAFVIGRHLGQGVDIG